MQNDTNAADDVDAFRADAAQGGEPQLYSGLVQTLILQGEIYEEAPRRIQSRQ
jgi:hypothetical protein